MTVDNETSEVQLPSRNLYTDEEVADLQASEAELVAAPLRSRVAELAYERMYWQNQYNDRERARAILEGQVREYDRDRTTERDRADRNMARAQKAEAEVERLKKGHVCTRSCKPDAHVAFTGRQRMEELEREAHDERERADRNKEWAERAEARLSKESSAHVRQVQELTDSLAARDRLLTRATLDLTEVTAQAQKEVDELRLQRSKVNGVVHDPEVRDALARLEMSEADYVVILANAVRKVRRVIGSPGPETSPA